MHVTYCENGMQANLTRDVVWLSVNSMRKPCCHRGLAAVKWMTVHWRARRRAAETWFDDFKGYQSRFQGNESRRKGAEEATVGLGLVTMEVGKTGRHYASGAARAYVVTRPARRPRSPRR